MSRAERRAYKRMTKNQDPYSLPAGAQQRLKAQQQQRRARRAPRRTEFTFWSGRALAWIVGGAFVSGLVGFSIAWPNGMPLALYIGVAATLAWGVLGWVVRSVQARAAANR
jgi:hypothetical protein